MILNYFNSYFEIFVGLNLGYAAFDYFRRELATKIFKTNNLSQNLENLKSRLKSHISEKSENEEFSKALSRFSEKVDVRAKTLDITEEKDSSFFDILKPISFLLSLLCMMFILIAGFQEQAGLVDKIFFSDYIFYLTCFTAVFSYTIFYCTFSDRILENELKISILQIILAFFVFATVSCNNVFKYLFEYKYQQLLALLFIPIFIYLVFTIFNVLRIKKYATREIPLLITTFMTLTYKNIKPTLIYLLILILAFTPVVLFYYNYLGLIFVRYTVVLVTPVFLFLFITIRVFFHKRKYGKLYKTLSVEHTRSLDLLLESLDDQ